MRRAMILVAGGSGTRMGAAVPKQFLLVNGKPLLIHTLQTMHGFDVEMELVLALPEQHFSMWRELCTTHHFAIPHTVVAGGETRFDSVKNALNKVSNADLIGVHDGVRPLVSKEVVERCFEAAEQFGSAVPAVPIVQSLRKMNGKSSIAVNRDEYYSVQTPQCFRADVLKDAYSKATHNQFSDDASVVEATGKDIALVEGNIENIKVTSPIDLQLASLLIS